MTKMTRMTEAEASAALEQVERSRRRVIDEIGVPQWYWWGLALGWVGLGIVTDLGHPWLTAALTLLFGAVHASVAPRVIDGRHRTSQLSVRADVVGRRVHVLVIAGLILLALVTIVVALLASADGARHPVSAASIVVGVVLVVGGPRLMAAVRGGAARAGHHG
jgi:hypothetical protein